VLYARLYAVLHSPVTSVIKALEVFWLCSIYSFSCIEAKLKNKKIVFILMIFVCDLVLLWPINAIEIRPEKNTHYIFHVIPEP
jgi:hypothetical protein